MKRRILVILSNRYLPSKPARFMELDCKADGTILKERPLKRAPRSAVYDEVWENDDGKASVSDCNRFKRKYPHPLEKRRTKPA